MTRRFFYNSDQLLPLVQHTLGESISVTDEIHHHWCRVLRANIGDTASLFDGFGGEYTVELTEVGKKSSRVTLLSYSDSDNTPPMVTEIGLVMSRGDRMDYAIQKATEMGVTAIQLLSSHHGEVRLKPAQVDKKLNHWQQVAISACEQCGLNRIPLIISPMPLMDWLKKNHAEPPDSIEPHNICSYMKPIAVNDFYHDSMGFMPADLSMVLTVPHDGEPSTPSALHKIINKSSSGGSKPFFKLLIGAEGGLSITEIQVSRQVGFEPWQIGNRVLRTETAPVVALTTLQAFFTAKAIF